MAGLPVFGGAAPRARRRPALGVERLEARALLSAAPVASIPDLIAEHDAGRSATDNKTNVTTPTFTGTAGNAETVRIFVGSRAVGTVPVLDGRWSFTHPGFANGRHAVSAEAVAADGRTGRRTRALTVEIRSAAVAPPALGIVRGKAPPTTAAAVATNEARPTFGGRGPTDGSVELSVGGAAAGTATVRRGTFTIRPSAPLGSGEHVVTAVATDPFGNRSGPTTLMLSVDADAPVVESMVRTSLTSVAVTFSEPVTGINLGSFTFSGRTSDGLQIRAVPLTDRRIPAAIGQLVGQLSPDGRTYTIDAPDLYFDAGTYVIGLSASAKKNGSVTDLAGNRLARDASLTIAIEG